MATASGDTAMEGKTFLGHPRGLLFLAMTEVWERFSFYGMRGLLVLYMVQTLLLPGRIEKVAGIETYRSVVEGIFGPMSTQALASQTFGLYSGFVYLTPFFGGLIADRLLGARKTVLIGVILMTAGHFAMAFDASFLLALLLLVLGSGCLKGNVAAQVGHLYPPDHEARRAQGFTIFSTGINVGAMLGPFICGLVAQIWGWHAGFGLAGLLMLLAGVFYVAGWRHFADDRPAHTREGAAPISAADWRMLGLVFLVVVLNLGWMLPYDQSGNVGLIWAATRVDLSTPFGPIPAAWFNSIDALSSIVFAPLLIALWSAQAARGREPHDTTKMAQGSLVVALAMLSCAAGAWQAGDAGKAWVLWPILTNTLTGLGFILAWPTVLALVSRRAPAGVNAMAVAGAYALLFVTGIGSGWVARFYERMPEWQFFALHAAVGLAGAALLAVLGPVLRRRMERLEHAA